MLQEKELYNQRQLRLMLKKIDYYENSSVSLKHMLASVESLSWNLFNFDKNWVNKTSEFEGNIDYCYLNFKDKNLKRKDQLRNKKELDALIIELKNHIKMKINTNLSDKDVKYKY